MVPDEAQQALVFLAPATGGDFSTLRNAVRAVPEPLFEPSRTCKRRAGQDAA